MQKTKRVYSFQINSNGSLFYFSSIRKLQKYIERNHSEFENRYNRTLRKDLISHTLHMKYNGKGKVMFCYSHILI